MGKVIMLEQVMTDNMKSQQENIQVLRQEMQASRGMEPKTPTFPEIRITGETPSKKRKTLADEQPQLDTLDDSEHAQTTAT